MVIADVIEFKGPQDALVWKSPIENFNAATQLIVDETHEALLVVNGSAADLFPAGRRTLSSPNIPLARSLVEIPTDGVSPFPCKVFFIRKVHAMELLWGTRGPITLEDPLYDIFLHVMANGNMSISIENPRKFLLKLAGFRDQFDPDEMVDNFRGIISTQVKNYVSKIMINGKLSYFMMNAHLFELSGVIKERLDKIFEDYGIRIEFFNIETIEVPEADYQEISAAKNRRTSRLIEGYTWVQERQMLIAEKFASNEGTIGGVSGAFGGIMMGGVMSGSITDIARSALSPESIPTEKPPKNAQGTRSHVGGDPVDVDVLKYYKPKTEPAPEGSGERKICCVRCGEELPQGATFCPKCGTPAPADDGKIVCPDCGHRVHKDKFCSNCGHPLKSTCPNCGTPFAEGANYCSKCGTKL